jgi:[ribosomal protein S5]-alanine N-acetyltransferase
MRLDCGSCLVRDWSRADKASLVRFANNRNVWRNLRDRFPHPYTAEHADGWFAYLAAMSEPTHWAIEVDGEAVGGVGVELDSGHFGYWLGEPYWGRGIATAAVSRTAPYVLEHFGLARLESPVFEWNPASMRVLEKCGFARERMLPRSIAKDGRLIDQVLYARMM